MRTLAILFLVPLVSGSNDWDILIFTQHWPSSACLAYEESNNHHFCERPKIENSWTIHGVWPTKFHTIGPGFCDPSLKFNISGLDSIHSELISSWPNLEGGKTEDSLWDHEWTKHGTCAVTLASLNSEEKYFKKGLEWFQKNNMSSILAQSGIVSSDIIEYDVQSIHDAVYQVTGNNPNIQCILEKHTKKPYLFEIRICFDKGLSLVHCDGTLGYANNLLTNCPKYQTVKYPVHVQPNEKSTTPSSYYPDPTVVKRSTFGRTLRNILRILEFLDWIV